MNQVVNKTRLISLLIFTGLFLCMGTGCQKDDFADIAKNIEGTYSGSLEIFSPPLIPAISSLTKSSKDYFSLECVFGSNVLTFDSLNVVSSGSDSWKLKYAGNKQTLNEAHFSCTINEENIEWGLFLAGVYWRFRGSKTN